MQFLALQFWKAENLTNWLTKDQKKIYAKHYGICMFSDPDYTGSLLAANPHHAPLLNKLFPTREMFHPVAKALLKVRHVSSYRAHLTYSKACRAMGMAA